MESFITLVFGLNAGVLIGVLAIIALFTLGSASSLLLALIAGSLFIFTGVAFLDLIHWVQANPGTAALYVIGYFLIGTIWSRIWFQINLSRVKSAYSKQALKDAIAADMQDPAVWTVVLQAISQRYTPAYSSGTKHAVLGIVQDMVTALSRRGVRYPNDIVWALIHNDAATVFQKMRSQLVHQIWEYPLHIVDFLLRDFVVDICRAIVRALRHVYEAIANKYGAEIKADFAELHDASKAKQEADANAATKSNKKSS